MLSKLHSRRDILRFLAAAPSAALAQTAKVDERNEVSPIGRTEPQRITNNPGSNDQLLYFTSPSLLSDDRRLVFISDQGGDPNLFLRDLQSGEEHRLTSNSEGMLKSYVYFDGQPYRGFGKASVSLHAPTGTVYFIQGRTICQVNPAGRLRVLAEYPAGQMTAFTHVCADGTRLCVPTTDARALDGDNVLPGRPKYDIDARVQEEGLSSWLHVYDTTTGKEILRERVPKSWITHVQFSPVDRNLILYNHEWPGDCGIRRIWLWNGKQHIRMRTEGDGRSRADWTCHEMWERDGSAIIYHGNYDKGPSYVGHVSPDGSQRVEIPFPAGWKRYGHFTEGRPGVLVTDGYYERPDDPDPKGYGAWISVLRVGWESETILWLPLCRHGSSWRSQDEHPHPVFDHAGKTVVFTSDRSGKRAGYRANASV
jgi:oligogalacturonide lyase